MQDDQKKQGPADVGKAVIENVVSALLQPILGSVAATPVASKAVDFLYGTADTPESHRAAQRKLREAALASLLAPTVGLMAAGLAKMILDRLEGRGGEGNGGADGMGCLSRLPPGPRSGAGVSAAAAAHYSRETRAAAAGASPQPTVHGHRKPRLL